MAVSSGDSGVLTSVGCLPCSSCLLPCKHSCEVLSQLGKLGLVSEPKPRIDKRSYV